MNIFWTIVVIILVLWLLGFSFGVAGGLTCFAGCRDYCDNSQTFDVAKRKSVH